MLNWLESFSIWLGSGSALKNNRSGFLYFIFIHFSIRNWEVFINNSFDMMTVEIRVSWIRIRIQDVKMLRILILSADYAVYLILHCLCLFDIALFMYIWYCTVYVYLILHCLCLKYVPLKYKDRKLFVWKIMKQR